jgi:excisionase family DNA binding protein
MVCSGGNGGLNMSEFNEPVTVTIPTAMRASGLGRTKLYELIRSNELESLRVGSRRLIVFASLKARLTANAANAAKGGGAND